MTKTTERLVAAALLCGAVLAGAASCPEQINSPGPPPGLSFPADASSQDPPANEDITEAFAAEMVETYVEGLPSFLNLITKMEWTQNGLLLATTSIASAGAPDAQQGHYVCAVMSAWAIHSSGRTWGGTLVRAANGDRLSGRVNPTDPCT